MSSAALSVPSHEDVLREIRQYTPGMQLYRGHDQWFKFEFAGRDYWFAPDLGGKMVKHPVSGQMVPADGILRVKGVYGRLQEKHSRKFTGAYGEMDDQTVSAIIMFAVTNYSSAGAVWLHGDETDEARKKASKTLVRNHNKAWSEQQRDARAGFVENWKKIPTNAGRRVPPPTDAQRRAQKYLDYLASEGSEGFQYVCEHGCSDFEEFADYARHMKVNHAKVVTQTAAPEVPPPAPLVGDDHEPTVEEAEAAAAQAAAAAAPETLEKDKDKGAKKRGK